MDFNDVVRNRRAVRDYGPMGVDEFEVEALINTAIEAPSAMNIQPWAFAVILGRKQIDHYAARAQKWLQANQAALSDSGIRQRFEERMHSDPNFSLFYHAPALVLVLAKSSAPQAVEDCCLAAQNLMLAARDHQLGTCWIGFARPWLNLPETKAELGLPKEYAVVAPIVLGYPKSWPEWQGRKPAEVHWIPAMKREESEVTA